MDEFIIQAKKLRDKVERLYVYGAGLYGQTMYQSLIQNQIKPDGFLVTVCNENRNILGMQVFSIQEITFEKTGIILGLNKFNTIEVIESLRQKGFDMDYVLYRKEFVRNAGSECVLNENPMIEVTTRIGCKVNCYYCPQELLLDRKSVV